MLFSTGFGFWGLARTSPQFIFTGTAEVDANSKSKMQKDDRQNH